MNETRKRIDEVDDEILELLAQRLELSLALGEAKKRLDLPIYDPLRERAILERLMRRNASRVSPEMIAAIWREVFSASRHAQSPLRVAYLGPEGTFTHQAVMARFGSSVESVASRTIAAAFGWIRNQTVDFAVLPVENTLQGIVGQTVDLLGRAGLPLVVDEIVLPIHFVFATGQDRLEGVKRIYSKQEAFPQCGEFLQQPALRNAELVSAASTSEAARLAAKDREGAALASDIAATLAGVPILFRHVEDNAMNKTRFLILGHRQPEPTGDDQTSVFARVRNVAGGLVGLLKSFSDRGINLTKIESRPMDEAANFESWFYINFDGHILQPGIADIIKEHEMVWLGSYRKHREHAMEGR